MAETQSDVNRLPACKHAVLKHFVAFEAILTKTTKLKAGTALEVQLFQ